MIFSAYVYILLGTILYKHGWNRSLDKTNNETLIEGMSA